jgi:5-methylcytosine-specific restriction protein B
MDKAVLTKHLDLFAKEADNWFNVNENIKANFKFFAIFFAEENLKKSSWEDFQEMGNHIHAFNSLAIAKGNALGNPNLPIEKYREIFLYIKNGEDPVDTIIDNLKNKKSHYHLPQFGESSISELITYARPNEFVIYNRRSVEALKTLSIDFPAVRGESFGKKFKRYNEIITPVKDQYTTIVGKKTNTSFEIELDQFFSWVYETNHKKGKGFPELMQSLATQLKKDLSILKDFSFDKPRKDYVWILDHKNIIGGKNAHYEIIKRKDNIFIELHLEGKVPEKNKIISGLKSLPDGVEWFKWDKSESLRLSESFKMSDETILNNLRNGLLKLEEGIGDKVRELLHTVNPPAKKETIAGNQILFGPPGTGKTFNTINKAVAIANPAFDISRPRKEVKKEFDRLLDLGQIVFTTFHQSMSYEDFVEGIKPLEPRKEDSPVNYKVIDGIFKKTALYALFDIFQSQEGEEVSKAENFESLYQEFCDYINDEIEENGPIHLKTLKKGNPLRVTGVEENGTILMSHLKKNQTDEWEETLKTPENLKKIYDKFENIGELGSIQDLKDIGIRSWRSGYATIFKFLKEFEKDHYSKKSTQTKLSYSTVKEITRNYVPPIIADSANYKNFVIIIDEINRGNVAAILGELITLIEEDKRLGCDEALLITLPYSKEKFGVPRNLYIIGTMNTADRSVEALDTALRRRFSFSEMTPLYDLEELKYQYAGFYAWEILKAINIRIEKLLDKDHLIGHSYFLKKKDQPEEDLLRTFYKNIIPLLQEYFFGDFGKIGLVLGEGFVSQKEWEKAENTFADFSAESGADFEDKPVYRIIDYRTKDHGHKLRLKDNQEVEMTFEKAIKVLMRKSIE